MFYRRQDSSGISIWSTLAADASHFLPVHLTPVHVNLPSAGGGAGLPHVACRYGGDRAEPHHAGAGAAEGASPEETH